MRFVSLICLTVCLSACATSTLTKAPDSALAGLPTSDLKPGQCGLFGWSTDESRDFIFYADAETSRYASLNGPIDLVPQSKFPATEYADPSGRAVSLRLGEGEVMSGGIRYPGARIVTLTDDGWERLHPVAIVKTCQPTS